MKTKYRFQAVKAPGGWVVVDREDTAPPIVFVTRAEARTEARSRNRLMGAFDAIGACPTCHGGGCVNCSPPLGTFRS